MTHNAVFTGAGFHCATCGAAWDQGEEGPAECRVACTKPIGPEEDGVRRIFDGERAEQRGHAKWFGATGDADYLRDGDTGGRRFWPIMPDAARPKPPIACTKPIGPEEEGVRRIFDGDHRPTPKSSVPVPRSATPPYVTQESFDRAFPKADPMAVQHGGSHYKNLVIQPTEFCMKNGLDFCVGSILKYVTRHRSKNGVEDLKKGRHFVEIREAFPYHIRPPGRIEITMLEYVTRNSIRPDDAEALYRLEAYYNGYTDNIDDKRASAARRLIEEIDRLIAFYG